MPNSEIQVTKSGFNPTGDQVELLKRSICKGSSDDEFQLFLNVAKRTGLDPFARQIHAVKRWDFASGRETMAVQTGIDGFRLIAVRTGRYEGQTEPQWCGKDGVWKEVWTEDSPPFAARIGVHKTGFKSPAWGVAHFDEYAQTKKGGDLVHMWAKMPRNQIAKCAEALAFRKAFPQELSGLYTADELTEGEPGDRPKRHAVATDNGADELPMTHTHEVPTDAVTEDNWRDILNTAAKPDGRFYVPLGKLPTAYLVWFLEDPKGTAALWAKRPQDMAPEQHRILAGMKLALAAKAKAREAAEMNQSQPDEKPAKVVEVAASKPPITDPFAMLVKMLSAKKVETTRFLIAAIELSILPPDTSSDGEGLTDAQYTELIEHFSELCEHIVKPAAEEPESFAVGHSTAPKVKAPPIDWHKVAVPVECNIKGEMLGEMKDGYLRACKVQLFPKIGPTPSFEEEVFIQAVNAAIEERGIDPESEEFAYIGNDKLQASIREKIDSLALTEEDGVKYLRQGGALMKDETLTTAPHARLLTIHQEWTSSILGNIQAMLNPKPEPKKKGSKK